MSLSNRTLVICSCFCLEKEIIMIYRFLKKLKIFDEIERRSVVPVNLHTRFLSRLDLLFRYIIQNKYIHLKYQYEYIYVFYQFYELEYYT